MRPPQWKDQASLDWYDRATLILWLPISFVYLAVSLIQLFGRTSWSEGLFWFDLAMSLLFVCDYLIRLGLSPDRRAFVRHIWNVADLIVIATPLFVLRFGVDWPAMLRVVRIVRLGIIGRRAWRTRRQGFRRGQVKWIALAAVGTVLLAGLTVWSAETTHTGASIKNGWDAAWWAIVTMCSVGYGETYPHSAAGKVAAVILMVAGISLFTWVTATLASLFVESDAERKANEQRDEMRRQIADIAGRVEALQYASGSSDSAYIASAIGTAPVSLEEPGREAQGEVVGIDWRAWEIWESTAMLARGAWKAAKDAYGREIFWWALGWAACIIALLQSIWAEGHVWSANLVNLAAFGMVPLLRWPLSWPARVTWILLLALSILTTVAEISNSLVIAVATVGLVFALGDLPLPRSADQSSREARCPGNRRSTERRTP